MKRIISAILAAIMLFGVVSFATCCFKGKDNSSNNNNANNGNKDSQPEASVSWPEDWGNE